ncbi:MAG: ComEC/Rec2 family competence protein [Acetobacteraceae bacterium]
MRDRLILWLPVAMGAGVLVYFALRAEPPWWAGPAIALPGALAAWAARGQAAGWRAARGALVLVAGFGLGMAAAQRATARAPPWDLLPRGAVTLTGTIRGIAPLPRGRRITLGRVRLGRGKALRRRVRVRLRDTDPARLAEGARIRLRAIIHPPSAPFVPGGWDLQRQAFFADLAGYGFALGRVRVLARPAARGPGAWMERLREVIAARFQAALPGARGAIAATLFTGEQTGIPAADRRAFRNSGLAHLLAVAGLHIGIVMGFAFALTRALIAAIEPLALRWPGKPLAALAALAAGGFYMLLTGGHVPILRSFAMAALVTLGVLAGRRAISLRGLALAAMALIVAAPQEVPGVSFQMSFSAVLALIAGYEALRPWLRALRGDGSWVRRAAGELAALALTSLLAGGASAPFAAYHFGHVQSWFVPANMIAVPVAALWVMPAGLLALPLLALHAEALALVPMGWGISVILWVARTAASLPGAVIATPPMPGAGLAVLALGMAWLGLTPGRRRWLGLAGIALGLAAPLLTRPADVLVAGNGRMLAVRTKRGVYVLRGRGASGFALGEWSRYWGGAVPRPVGLQMQAGGGAVRCFVFHCLLRPRRGGGVLRVAARPVAGAAVAVLPRLFGPAVPAGRDAPDGGGLRITPRLLRRDGNVALWLSPRGPRMESANGMRGDRPWVIPPRRRRIRLPFAPEGP